MSVCVGLSQLDKLVEKQRETHRRMLEQLLMVEQAHKQALYKLEDEKRNHGEFMKKSDEFTNLLEQERERSVSLGLTGRGGSRVILQMAHHLFLFNFVSLSLRQEFNRVQCRECWSGATFSRYAVLVFSFAVVNINN